MKKPRLTGWKKTGICPSCGRRAITAGNCLDCGWVSSEQKTKRNRSKTKRHAPKRSKPGDRRRLLGRLRKTRARLRRRVYTQRHAQRRTPGVGYGLEVANRIERGQAVGNLYGVARYIDDRRNTYVLNPQPSKVLAKRTKMGLMSGRIADKKAAEIAAYHRATGIAGEISRSVKFTDSEKMEAWALVKTVDAGHMGALEKLRALLASRK